MLHVNIVKGDIHYIQNWEVADAAARLALVTVAADEGRVARQLDTGEFYVLQSAATNKWQSLNASTATTIAKKQAAVNTKLLYAQNKAAATVFAYRNFS